jgi:hypothetical protein
MITRRYVHDPHCLARGGSDIPNWLRATRCELRDLDNTTHPLCMSGHWRSPATLPRQSTALLRPLGVFSHCIPKATALSSSISMPSRHAAAHPTALANMHIGVARARTSSAAQDASPGTRPAT